MGGHGTQNTQGTEVSDLRSRSEEAGRSQER